MRELQTINQEVYQSNARIAERRKEIYKRLEELVKRPSNEWTLRDRTEIHTLVYRLFALI